MSQTEEEVPILNEIIQPGDAAIIRSSRRRLADRESVDAERLHFELPAHLLMDGLLGDARNDSDRHRQVPSRDVRHTAWNEQASEQDPELDSLIDDIVDRHMAALRQDLRALLERALGPA